MWEDYLSNIENATFTEYIKFNDFIVQGAYSPYPEGYPKKIALTTTHNLNVLFSTPIILTPNRCASTSDNFCLAISPFKTLNPIRSKPKKVPV